MPAEHEIETLGILSMADEQNSTQSGQRFRVPLIPVLLIVLILGFALFGRKGILRSLQASRHNASLQAELHKQEAVIEQLKQEIEALRSDRKHIESIARRELGMVKDNELVYQFAEGSDVPEARADKTVP